MPKETFLKLPNEKKEKIIKAAQKEFERVPIEEASIKILQKMQKLHVVVFINILKAKKIYFGFILNKHFKQMNEEIKNNIIEANGDIFKCLYLCMSVWKIILLKKKILNYIKNI